MPPSVSMPNQEGGTPLALAVFLLLVQIDQRIRGQS